MKVRLTLRALGDLDDISDYLLARNPTAARAVRTELERALRLLATHPRAGRAYAGGRRRFALRRFPYLIFYRIDVAEEVVEVTTIRHAAREGENS